LEVIWRLENLDQRVLSMEITQTSEGFLLLQSTTCWRTNEPVSCCARGAVFWAESEARVQVAPSGMMKRRKVGLSMFALLFGLSLIARC
jgi:hypothetical protein